MFNKTDLVSAVSESVTQQPAICISAKTGQGLQELRAYLLHSVGWLDQLPGSSFAVDPPPFLAVGLWYGSLIYLFVHASGNRQRICAFAGAGTAVLWAILA